MSLNGSDRLLVKESSADISGSIKRITEFLNAFNMSCSGKLADLNSKLSMLERKVAFLESKVEIYDRKKIPLGISSALSF